MSVLRKSQLEEGQNPELVYSGQTIVESVLVRPERAGTLTRVKWPHLSCGVWGEVHFHPQVLQPSWVVTVTVKLEMCDCYNFSFIT